MTPQTRCPTSLLKGHLSSPFAIENSAHYPSLQTFLSRLPEVVDQAQHFASITTATAGAGAADPSGAFREGLDGTERERAYSNVISWDCDILTAGVVFTLAQMSVQSTKKWYSHSYVPRK